MKGLFLDATESLAEVFRAMSRDGDPTMNLSIQAQVAPGDPPAMLAGYNFILDDHTALPTEAISTGCCPKAMSCRCTCC